jgi:hypothetical protein
MAGFEAPRTIYKLDFEGTDLEGLEVRMRAGRLGDMLDPSNADIGLDIDPDNPSAEDIKAVRAKFEMIAEYLASWNLTEDGVPVPATIEGLMDQEPAFVGRIFAAWQKAQVDVSGPLPSSSTSTSPPDLSSIPTESLSPSLLAS